MTGVGELIERVEGLKGADRETDFWLTVMVDNLEPGATIYTEAELRADIEKVGLDGMYIRASYTSSLDAAVAFTEALLPGAEWSLDRTADKAIVTMWAKMSCAALASAGKPTPALALVLAALRAHAARETT